MVEKHLKRNHITQCRTLKPCDVDQSKSRDDKRFTPVPLRYWLRTKETIHAYFMKQTNLTTILSIYFIYSFILYISLTEC